MHIFCGDNQKGVSSDAEGCHRAEQLQSVTAQLCNFRQNSARTVHSTVALKCAKKASLQGKNYSAFKTEIFNYVFPGGMKNGEKKKKLKNLLGCCAAPLPSTLLWLGCLSSLPNGAQLSVKINLQQIVSIRKVEAILQSFMRLTGGGLPVDPKQRQKPINADEAWKLKAEICCEWFQD